VSCIYSRTKYVVPMERA